MSQVKAIRASLKTNGRAGAEVRTVKAQAPIMQQQGVQLKKEAG